MKTRSMAACAAVLSLFGVSAAQAVEGVPVTGIGVSVESSPGGIVIPTADCVAKKNGTLVKQADGKWICQLPLVAGAPLNATMGAGGRPLAGSAMTGNPVQGVGVSVETSPGGIVIPTADCAAKKNGTLVKQADGKWICQLPLVAGPPMTGQVTGTLKVTPPPPPAKGN